MTEAEFKKFVQALKDEFGSCVECPYFDLKDEDIANIYIRGNKYKQKGEQNAAIFVIRILITQSHIEKRFSVIQVMPALPLDEILQRFNVSV